MEFLDITASMPMRQIASVVGLGLCLMGLVLHCIRRRLLRERCAMVWVVIALVMVTTPLMYPVYGMLAALMGIINVTSLLFFLAILGISLLCLQFSLALSSAYGQRKGVIQRTAMLEERVVQLENEIRRLKQGDA